MKTICIGNYPPRKCGIATFTENLINSIINSASTSEISLEVEVIAMNDKGKQYDYPSIVTRSIDCNNKKSYIETAEYINSSGASLVLVQHEYGIYGGESGLFLLDLLRRLKIGVVSTFHTVLRNPTFHQKEVLMKIAQYSSRIIVMNPIAIGFLTKVFNVPENKIRVIEHGVPDFSKLVDNDEIIPDNWKDRKVMLTFGLIGRSKGIETVIKALPEIVKKHPEILYVVLGKTHPHIIEHSGEEYREYLYSLTKQSKLLNNVVFINEYVSEEVLMQYLKRADIYATPYLNKAQITSGTLAYAVSGGSAVISTPYWHAETLLSNERGKLFNFSDHQGFSKIVNDLLDDPDEMALLQQKAFNYGTQIVWSQIGNKYCDVFIELVNSVNKVIPEVLFNKFKFKLPEFNSSHLEVLTDKTGIVQHAIGSVADYRTGYCSDDNSRALVLGVMAYNRFGSKKYLKLIYRYLSFIMYMQNPDGTFRNFLSYSRTTDIDHDLDDTFGRSVWSLGFLIRYAPNDSLLQTAKELFCKAVNNHSQLVYARGYANCILGLYHYLKRYPDHEALLNMLVSLSDQLCKKVNQHSHDDWDWFEPELTYDNGLLPAALYFAYEITDIKLYLEVAEKTRNFLERKSFKYDYLSIIGNKTWIDPKDGQHDFAQQPTDTMAMIIMYKNANAVLNNQELVEKLKLSFLWFFGKNKLNFPLYDDQTKGCNDGLEYYGVNRNQGAESIIAYLSSWLLTEQFFKKL